MSPRLAGSHNGRRPPEIALAIPEAATAARALDAAIALMYSHLSVPCPDCQQGPCAGRPPTWRPPVRTVSYAPSWAPSCPAQVTGGQSC